MAMRSHIYINHNIMHIYKMAMGVHLSSFNSMLHSIKSIILVKVFNASFYFTHNIMI
jgi:hypothetical protein